MAHLSGTFSSASAGRLSVTLTGSFFQGTNRDAGFPSGTSNLMIGGNINGNIMQPIDRNAPASYAEYDYPGGNAAWSVSTYTVANSSSGVASYGFTNLKLICQLIKK